MYTYSYVSVYVKSKVHRENKWYLSFWIWLISSTILFSSSAHCPADGVISFSSGAEWDAHVCPYHVVSSANLTDTWTDLGYCEQGHTKLKHAGSLLLGPRLTLHLDFLTRCMRVWPDLPAADSSSGWWALFLLVPRKVRSSGAFFLQKSTFWGSNTLERNAQHPGGVQTTRSLLEFGCEKEIQRSFKSDQSLPDLQRSDVIKHGGKANPRAASLGPLWGHSCNLEITLFRGGNDASVGALAGGSQSG